MQMTQAPSGGFSERERARAIERMRAGEFDLLVIGGGITGAGVARDAASRGMTVALVEAQDFAQGTSSRSSKLIHGGIRYLENFEFHLVFEALSERRLLFEIAPHLVHPLRFVLPLYEGGRVGMFKMGLGMWAYDALSMFEAPEMHERLSAADSVERLPLLRREGLLGSYAYSDAYMDDDRLVHETLRSAHALGAQCANFCRATDAVFDESGRVVGARCRDLAGGAGEFTIRARHTVSTVGPWTDRLGSAWFANWKRVLRPSKGIHLTFERKRLQLSEAVVMAADAEKRIVFGIPRHEMIVIGTTDTDYPGDPENVQATPDDVRYLLNVARHYFPGAKLEATDVISSYAGVRPLVHDGAETESKTSREHLIFEHERNVTFVAGGKYTTYRRMAEDAVRSALDAFSIEDRVRFRRSETKIALNPLATPALMDRADRESRDWARDFSLSKPGVDWLVSRHGYEALSMLERGQRAGTERSRLASMEAQHAMANQMCLRLIDFYVRRSPLFLADRDHGLPLLDPLAAQFAARYGWSSAKIEEEKRAVRDYVRADLAWKSAFGMDPDAY